MEQTYDIIVVGAGVAGCAAAIALAAQGRAVLLLERRWKKPDRIVGELLQPGGVAALEKLGLQHCLEGIDAIPVRGYHIYWKSEEVTFRYPPWPKESASDEQGHVDRPRAEGRSFHHGRFVSALRRATLSLKNIQVKEVNVTDLIGDGDYATVTGVRCSATEKSDEQTFHAALTIVADGFSSNLRSLLHHDKPTAKSRFWGLELLDVELPTPELAYGVIGRGPPILMYQIGTHEIRILVDIPQSTQKTIPDGDVKTYMLTTVLPKLPSSVQSAFEVALKDGRLRSMPNQWLPSTTGKQAGVLLLGNASNMRHALTGGGMTVALNDVVLLRDTLSPDKVKLGDHKAVLAALRGFHWRRKGHSASLNILAQALYTMFVADDPQLKIMQRGFFRYIKSGGTCVEEPSGLMGGLYQNPFLLFYHFFAIALYSMWLHLSEADFWLLPTAIIMCGMVLMPYGKTSYCYVREGWVDEPNKRGTSGILWSCILVIFACTWTVLHHNVPAPNEGWWTQVGRKARWSVVAVCAPELLSLFAVMQWNAANISAREMKTISRGEWTIVHAFYANAGGFVLQTTDYPAFPINATSLQYLVSRGWISIPNLTKEEIWDRSKADIFAKCVAFMQTGWLLLQMIGRAAQKLPITPLELFTIAFTAPTLATQYFWVNKPQNVGAPLVIKVDWKIADLLLAAGDSAAKPFIDTPMDFVEKPVWEGWKRRPSLLHYGGLETRPLVRIPNDYSPPPPTDKEATFIWIISVVHAGLHVIGWNFPFPSSAEVILWRISSLTLLIVMAVGGLVPVFSTQPWFDFSFNMMYIWVIDAKRKTFIRQWFFATIVNLAYGAYILARLVIFAELFFVFRSMPSTAYLEVQWSSFLPHV